MTVRAAASRLHTRARQPLLSPAFTATLRHRVGQAMGMSLLGLAGVLAAMLVSYHPTDPSLNTATSSLMTPDVHNWFGPSGALIADAMMQLFGLGAYVLVLGAAGWGLSMVAGSAPRPIGLRIFALLVAAIAGGLAAAAIPAAIGQFPIGFHPGGAFGTLLLPSIAEAGGYWTTTPALILSGLAVSLFGLGLAIGLSLQAWVGLLRRSLVFGRTATVSTAKTIGSVGRLLARVASSTAEKVRARRWRTLDDSDPLRVADSRRGRLRRAPHLSPAAPDGSASDDRSGVEAVSEELPKRPVAVVTPGQRTLEQGRRAKDSRQPTFDFGPSAEKDYLLPPLDLLQTPSPAADQRRDLSEESLQRNAQLLESVLADFGVKGSIQEVHTGPVVTLYELEPAPGTKSSRVIGLSDDIARSMSAVSVRVAVVPGRNAIGIELPNNSRQTVYLGEILGSSLYEKNAAKLPLVLGKNIGGEPVIADLARFPHLLIAGTTGSGKSVAINTMILSLLYRLQPDACRLILIDPKMLELSVYEGIPHLLTPVVTDPKKAVVALKWTVREMENRYRAMSKLGVRNIEGFNARLREARESGETLTRRVQTGFDPDTGKPLFEEQTMDFTELPYIVVVVDEMADLMLVAGKEIEGAIQRLAQMARAAGIHLIMATQRPSVDVVTGTIKANFPTRISFQVSSKIDSRTILGEQGAEQLLGHGDMLYMPGGGRLIRVHGPFVSDDEVEIVVKFLKTQGEPSYIEAVTADDEIGEGDSSTWIGGSGGDGGASGQSSGDDQYDRAVAVVVQGGKASISYVQRQLRIGYNSAARLIERMEEEGVVSKPNHAGKREILADREDEDER